MGYQKPPIGSRLNYGHPLARGLAGCWIFDEMSGDKVFDYSGHSNHGSIAGVSAQSGTSGWNAGPYGGVLALVTDDYVTVKDGAILRPPTEITVIAIVNSASIATAQNIVDHESLTPYYGYLLMLNASKALVNVAYPANGKDVSSVTTLASNTRYKIAFTYDGVNIKIFLDGRLDIATAATGAIAYTATQDLTIGKRCTGSTGYFNGSIEQVLIYNRCLTAGEIALHSVSPYCMFYRPFQWLAEGEAPPSAFKPRIIMIM
jgi:hypothetical protein